MVVPVSDRAESETANPRVVLVQCTNAKRDGTHEARKLYDESDYFRKQRAYARRADQWFIQSAEYGLLHPGDLVKSYDTHADDLDDPESWAEGIAAHLASYVPDGAVIEILGGRAYADPLVPELECRGYEVLEPVRGKQIGERKAWLLRQVDRSLEEYA